MVITHSMPLMINFMLLFLIVLAGFAFAHLLAYGNSIERFKNPTSSFYSMYRVLVGLTVLFNVFVAILMESYEATKAEEVGFVDMIAENIVQPFTQTMNKMFKRFKEEVEAVPNNIISHIPEADPLRPSARLARAKKAITHEEVCQS
jgi:ABC-type iron transport system FetAB permease component